MRYFLFIISFFTTISCIGQQKNPLKNFKAPNNNKIISSKRLVNNTKKYPVKDGKIYLNPEKGSVKSENSIQYLIDYYELNDNYSFNKIKNSENSFKYQQYYKGLPVFGNEIVIHNENGSVKRVRGRISNQLNIGTNPLISAKDAFLLGKEYLKLTSVKDTLVYDLIIYKHKEIFKLAYSITIESLKSIDSYRVFVDANTGEILNKISNIAHADIETNVVTNYSGQQPITTHLYQDNYYLFSEEKNFITQSWNNQFDTLNITNFYNNNNLWNDQEIILNSITISSMTNWWNVANVGQCPDIRVKIYNNLGDKVKDIQRYDDCVNIYFNNLNLSSSNAPYYVYIYERDDNLWGVDYDYGGTFEINLDNTENNTWNIGNNSGSYSTSLSISDEPKPELDAHWGAEVTHDYFTEKFSRNGFDNEGSLMRLFTNVGENWNNAGWVDEWGGYDNFMVFGDGDGIFKSFYTSLDIIGHEISHGLISSESCLDYIGESGALNESFADILGTAIEFFGKPENSNWTIAEDIYLYPSGNFMRSLENPKLKGQPDTYEGINWKDPQNHEDDNGGVHYNSGVQNYWFYLLSNGGSGVNDNGDEYLVNGIGINKAIDICYRNITEELTLLSDYEDAYHGSIDATQDLITEGVLSENDLFSVRQAWYAVGVGPQPELYCDDETTTLVDAFGTLTDGSDELDYLNQTNCSWIIKPAAANKITIHFTEFDLEEGYDFVRIYNGVNPDPSALIDELTGTINPFDVEASTFETDDDVGAMLIEFTSNFSGTSSGWSFDYYTDQDEIFCEGYSILSESSGTLDDGSGINNYYSNNQSCAWLIAPPCADSIYLEFNYFNIEPVYDSIWIFDGNSSLDPLLYANSGNWWPTELESVTSTSGEMLVIFWSDFTESNFLGFEAYYNSYGSVNCSETIILTDTSGIVSDYSLEEEYCNNSECFYLIQPQNAASIELEFTEFDLEDSPFGGGYYDYVQIFDGDSEEAPLIGTYGGSSIPGLIQSSGGSLYIKFKTDMSDTYQGWAANWSSNEIEPVCTTSHTLVLQSSDSLGWDDNSLQVQLHNNFGSFFDSTFTLVNDSIDFYCLDINSNYCNSFTLNNGDLDMGDSWSLYLSEINLDLNLVTTSTTDFDLGCIYGCTNELSLNYDESATIDDNSCILPVYGCTDVSAINFDINANVDDGSCIETVYGCTDPSAFNYNPLANSDNFSCIDVIEGCTDVNAFNYNPVANTMDFSCIEVIYGCTDPDAYNYDPVANTDNGICAPVIYGCTDQNAYNYDPTANTNNGICIPIIEGCTIPEALNFDQNANTNNGNCVFEILGCTDPDAFNYQESANTDDGSCEEVIFGCTDPSAFNFDVLANVTDGSCTEVVYGCTDSNAFNFDITANTDNGTCEDVIAGCTDPNAFNFNDLANIDDGSCIEIVYGCMDPNAFNFNDLANTNNGTCEDIIFGCTENDAFNYNPDANTNDNSCVPYILGCTDVNADNYNEFSNVDDNSCNYGDYENLLDSYCYPEPEITTNTPYINRFALEDIDTGYSPQNFNPTNSNYTDYSNLSTDLLSDSSYTGFLQFINFDNNNIINIDIFIDYNMNGEFEVASEKCWSNYTSWGSTGYNNINPTIDIPTLTQSGQTKMRVIVYLNNEYSNYLNNSCIDNFSGEIEDYTVNLVSPILGCTDSSATNYNTAATVDNGLCTYYPNCQNIPLPSGWSMFSSYIITEDMDVATNLSSIVNNVIITKNNLGQAYLVEFSFNGIGDMIVGQGYQIKTNANTSFDLCGTYAIPENNVIQLSAGWNMIGYLRIEPEQADIILQEINSSENLIIAKDYMGSAYLPEFNFNGIGYMTPGEGYQVKIYNSDTLSY